MVFRELKAVSAAGIPSAEARAQDEGRVVGRTPGTLRALEGELRAMGSYWKFSGWLVSGSEQQMPLAGKGNVALGFTVLY